MTGLRLPRTTAVAGSVLLLAAATTALAPASSATASAASSGDGVLNGPGTVLQVESLARVAGAVRLVATIANRSDDNLVLSRVTRQTGAPEGCLSFNLFDPATGSVGHPLGLASGQCKASKLPVFLGAGQQVTFAVDIADPGGTVLDVLNSVGGAVHGVAVSGAAAPSTDGVSKYQPRMTELNARATSNGARVSSGKKVSIDLDTDVLFAVDSATLSPRAKATLDTAAAELKKQSGRRVAVNGHTDSTGTSAHNVTLSLARANAVQQALAARLGAGWTYDVKGYGETKPLVPEVTASGAPDPAARALNRRVELAVS